MYNGPITPFMYFTSYAQNQTGRFIEERLLIGDPMTSMNTIKFRTYERFLKVTCTSTYVQDKFDSIDGLSPEVLGGGFSRKANYSFIWPRTTGFSLAERYYNRDGDRLQSHGIKFVCMGSK